MRRFWKQSPEWQRREELCAAWQAAKRAEEKAGELVLSAVRDDVVGGGIWRERVEAYKAAANATYNAAIAWIAASAAFDASAAGQARARYWKDPLAFREEESEVAA